MTLDPSSERARRQYVETLLAGYGYTLETVPDDLLLQFVRRGHSSILRAEARARNLL